MVWKLIGGVAQANENWGNFHVEKNCSPVKAKRIAVLMGGITCYMYIREASEFPQHGKLNKGDAVFFTTKVDDYPFLPFPQTDMYCWIGLSMVYVGGKDGTDTASPPREVKAITSDTMPNSGLTKVDIVTLYCGHYCTNDWPCLRSFWLQNPHSKKVFDPPIQQMLTDGTVKLLQDKGIVVLLCVDNADKKLGWSSFSSDKTGIATAQNFLNYLKSEVVDKYDLDGIDIDDEWISEVGPAQLDSLAMVTTLYKETMPEKLITKALWKSNDIEYFETPWKGNTLAKNLDYGWEMTYGVPDVMSRVQPYALRFKMKKRSILCGFSTKLSNLDSIVPHMKMLLKAGYGGAMLWAFWDEQGSTFEKAILDEIVQFAQDDHKEDCPDLLSTRENIPADCPVAKKDSDRGVDVRHEQSRAEPDQEEDTLMCCAML